MNIAHLRNLSILARKGLATISEGLNPDEAQAGWDAIKTAETFIRDLDAKQQEAQAQAQAQAADAVTDEGADLHIVNLNAEGAETQPQVEDDNS